MDLPGATVAPLPEELRKRVKTGFSVPVRDWLQAGGNGERGLRGWARRVYETAAGSSGCLLS